MKWFGKSIDCPGEDAVSTYGRDIQLTDVKGNQRYIRVLL